MSKQKVILVSWFAWIFVIAFFSLGIGGGKANADPVVNSYRFDFGTGALQANYTGVACNELYNSTTGYGWTSLSGLDGRDRASSTDALRKDFCFGSVFSYKVDLPNGSYNLNIIAGDAEAGQSGMNVSAEGNVLINNASAAMGTFIESDFTVNVQDGQLNLNFTGAPARINALVVTSLNSDPVWGAPTNGNWGSNALELKDNGNGTVTLKNNKASIIINKSSANITEIRYNGSNPTLNLGTGGYLANYQLNGVAGQKAISGATYTIVSQSASRIELSFLVNDPNKLPFQLDVRIVMEANSPGFYYYTLYKYPTNMPAGLKFDQLRYAFRPTNSVFKNYAIDDQRIGTFPTSAELTNAPELQDATELLPDGKVYTKYQQISNLEGDNHVFGVYGTNIGMSMIQASKEYFAGGPTKQELTTHTTSTGPVLIYDDYTSHYNDTNFMPPYGWQKVFGPFYLYLNEGASTNAMWADAKAAALTEQSKWPYTWISSSLYASSTRGKATGQLNITDGTSPNNAWVILGASDKDWQFQNLDYLYYVRAANDGSFTIPAIRPGTYTLYAFVDGVLGEYRQDNVTVTANGIKQLGVINWTPKTNGTKLWQIGTPNRSAAEFHITSNAYPTRIPGGDKYRQFGTWFEYPLEFPNGVDFKIGTSNAAVNWNYFQPATKTPGDPQLLKVPQNSTPSVWKIRFDSNGYTSGTGTLTFGLAGSVYGSLLVKVNGVEVGNWATFAEGPVNDSSLYRQGIRGVYRQVEAKFNANLIHSGENIVELSLPTSPGTIAWTNVNTSIMYDVVRLEVQ